MSAIFEVIRLYMGTGYLLVLYAAAVVYLFLREKNKMVRLFLIWLPLLILVVFLLPPFYFVYGKIEGTETYYRILWMIPVGATIAYASGKLFASIKNMKLRPIAMMLLCLSVVFTGQAVYGNINVSKAENRLHLPQTVVDISDYILSVSEGSRNIMVAMPSELVHFVRQYDIGIRMPYGREMLVSSWGFDNEVYDAMERPEEICAEDLAKAAKDARCNYIVLHQYRAIDEDLTEYGYEKQVLLDDYYIYYDPELPFL